MKRTKIQKIIIPRNWLFGRLAYINNNLKNIIRVNTEHFTKFELEQLKNAQRIISNIYNGKDIQRNKLKQLIRHDRK